MHSLLQIGLANAIVATAAAVGIWIISRFIRQPALAHVLWLLVLLKLLTPPLLQIRFPILAVEPKHVDEAETDRLALASSNASPVEPATDSRRNLYARRSFDERHGSLSPTPQVAGGFDAIRRISRTLSLSILAGLVWCAGSIFCATIICVRTIRFERLLRFAAPAPPDIARRTSRLARRLRLRRSPAAHVLPGAVCPMLWCGTGRPRLLLPAALWDRLDDRQRDSVLLHELAHFRRRDYWVRWLEAAATTLFWWHPVCWWARHELREAEEQCCDAWVMRILPGSFRSYAAALVQAADFVSSRVEPPLMASGASQFAHLKRRLLLIKRGDVPQTLSALGTGAAAVFGAVLLPLVPLPGRPAAPRTAQSTPTPFHERRPDHPEARPDAVGDGGGEINGDDPRQKLDLIEAQAMKMLQEVRELREQSRGGRAQRTSR